MAPDSVPASAALLAFKVIRMVYLWCSEKTVILLGELLSFFQRSVAFHSTYHVRQAMREYEFRKYAAWN